MRTKTANVLEAVIKILKANFSPIENYYMKPSVSLHEILHPQNLPTVR